MNQRLEPILYLCFLLFMLIACNPDDKSPPQTTITSPATGSAVSGTFSVQITATDDVSVANVKLYGRSPNSKGDGQLLGTAVKQPFIINVNSLELPNLAELDLYAIATDFSAKEGKSSPTRIRIQNPGVPKLNAFYNYIYPAEVRGQQIESESLNAQEFIETFSINTAQPPHCFPDCPQVLLSTDNVQHKTLATQSLEGFKTVLAWEVTCNPSVDGYRFYKGDTDLVGPYTFARGLRIPQNCTQFQGTQQVTDTKIGDIFYGLVKAVSNNETLWSGHSNADKTTFITQTLITSPQHDSKVPEGRPNLSWQANSQADGYYYYIYDRPPLAQGSRKLWTNYPQATRDLQATYPTSKQALPAGTYYWWVAGVSFDKNRIIDSISFSEVRRFVVP